MINEIILKARWIVDVKSVDGIKFEKWINLQENQKNLDPVHPVLPSPRFQLETTDLITHCSCQLG